MARSQADCKHQLDRVDIHSYRSGKHRWTFYSCQDCGSEWETEEVVEDLNETVSANEIIEVHRLLEQEGKSLEDMTE